MTPPTSDAAGPRFVLVGGGARSGKSRFALARAAALGPRRLFIATAEAQDDEMRRASPATAPSARGKGSTRSRSRWPCRRPSRTRAGTTWCSSTV